MTAIYPKCCMVKTLHTIMFHTAGGPDITEINLYIDYPSSTIMSVDCQPQCRSKDYQNYQYGNRPSHN